LADRAVVGGSNKNRGGYRSVHGQQKMPLTHECPGDIQRKDMSLRATFKGRT
jgi:hypothetical protein